METGVPIVPAKIKGGFEILKRGTWDLHWGRLSLQFFPPIETDMEKTIEELMQEVRSRLE